MGHGAPVHEVDAQGHRGRQAVTTHASCQIVLVNFDAGSPGWARPVKRSWTKPVSDPRRPWTNQAIPTPKIDREVGRADARAGSSPRRNGRRVRARARGHLRPLRHDIARAVHSASMMVTISNPPFSCGRVTAIALPMCPGNSTMSLKPSGVGTPSGIVMR